MNDLLSDSIGENNGNLSRKVQLIKEVEAKLMGVISSSDYQLDKKLNDYSDFYDFCEEIGIGFIFDINNYDLSEFEINNVRGKGNLFHVFNSKLVVFFQSLKKINEIESKSFFTQSEDYLFFADIFVFINNFILNYIKAEDHKIKIIGFMKGILNYHFNKFVSYKNYNGIQEALDDLKEVEFELQNGVNKRSSQYINLLYSKLISDHINSEISCIIKFYEEGNYYEIIDKTIKILMIYRDCYGDNHFTCYAARSIVIILNFAINKIR